ncbi:unnamed protein product [Acanthoscelides obtectus]|nr:unnamed protein product [Acanthoscelides obtectus]CAK1658670.1 Coiled-coil and C2 domain-containing protein 2A [Acanthoscelides obtectus]
MRLKSPVRTKIKRNNKVAQSCSNSICSTSDESNIISVFSATEHTHSTKGNELHESSISLTDSVFVKPGSSENKKQDSGQYYRQKLSEHLNRIRQKASGSANPQPLKSIKSEEVDTPRSEELAGLRSRLHVDATSSTDGRRAFFAFNNEEQKESPQDYDKNVYYMSAEWLDFVLQSTEKEWFFQPTRQPLEISTKQGIVDPPMLDDQDIFKINLDKKVRIRNIIEQRLLADGDRRWFDTNGELFFLNAMFKTDAFLPKDIPIDYTLTIYKPPYLQQEFEEVRIIKDQILNLYLSELKFSFHPLFSCEHLFAEQLRHICDEYSKSKTKEIKKQLDALRNDKESKEEDKAASEDSEDTEKRNLTREIKKLRTQYFRDLEKERIYLKTILEVWKQIKTIREQQGYSNTDIHLKILKKPVDLEADAEAYDTEFELTLKEIIDEHKAKEAKDTDTESIASSVKTDEDKLKQKLTKRFKKCMRQPGEPVVSFVLSKQHQVTEEVANFKEKARIDAVASTKLYLRILCKNIEACKTPLFNLSDDFIVDINETFSLQLVDVPQYLIVEVIEQPKALQKKKVCELQVNIPPSNSNGYVLEKLYFEKDEIIHYKHEGLGSGIDIKTAAERMKLKILNLENYELKTSGALTYSIKWEKLYEATKEFSYEDKFRLVNDVVDKNSGLNIPKLKELAEHETNEENKKTYLDFIEHSKNEVARLNTCEELQFCEISKIEQNIRFTLLRLRDKKEIEFDGILVPNRVKEIPFNILADYKRRKAAEEKGYLSDEYEYEDEFESQRKYGKKYLKQVYTKVFQRCKNTENNLEYKSVVNEKFLIHFQFLIKIILKKAINWLKWRPTISNPLPTLVKPTAKEKYQTRIVDNVHITIHVLNGKNLPSRNKYTFNTDGKTENELRPFVRINYKNVWIRSTASKGSNPVWNETLNLPLESFHTDYQNPNSLNCNISIDIFDESNYEMKQRHRKRYNWLGGVEIPISSICDSEIAMQGLFKVRLPHILLGYQTEEEKFKTKSPKTSNTQSHQAYLQLDISISPAVPKLSPNMEDLPCGDLPYIKEHILKWSNSYNYSFRSRSFSAMVIDIQCKTLCATRYIGVVEPPQINQEEFDLTPEQCLRYVSLVPFTEYNHFFNNIWLSTKQLLQLLIGSTIDHAIALTCYLLALKMEAWLLLAYGIPHGKTAYVLVKEYSGQTDIPRYYVLDVVNAEKYYVDDPYCPVQKVYCLVNGENIWANIQKTDDIAVTNFNLNRKSDWQQLFSKDHVAPAKLSCHVAYKVKNDTKQLEMQLERKIKRQITKLRQLNRTVWNKHISDIFKHTLKSLEMNCMYNKNFHETISDLHRKISAYKVYGYAINIPFTSILDIVKRIKSMDMHLQDGDNEFALAVYLHSFSGGILSVWILFGIVDEVNETVV